MQFVIPEGGRREASCAYPGPIPEEIGSARRRRKGADAFLSPGWMLASTLRSGSRTAGLAAARTGFRDDERRCRAPLPSTGRWRVQRDGWGTGALRPIPRVGRLALSQSSATSPSRGGRPGAQPQNVDSRATPHRPTLVPPHHSPFPTPSFVPSSPTSLTIALSPFRGNTGRDGDCVGRDRRLRRIA